MSQYPDMDNYALWCECHSCSACDGVGEDWIEDDWNQETEEYGKLWVCKHCDGSGIEPGCTYFDEKV
jgi:hypothetical protein